ncbi:MAG: hypothetical protein Q8L78_05510 [Coxiellaceae bacterium]|nr:hypothetical protein [Coxiellaceae bacterium]
MLKYFSGSSNVGNGSPKERVDFLRKLSAGLGDWLSDDESQGKLAEAINYALADYKRSRDGVVDGVRGSQEPVEADPDAGLMSRFISSGYTVFQGVRSALADYVVDPGLSNSAEKLASLLRGDTRASAGNAREILMYFREELESGWAGERMFGLRVSLNTLVVHYVLQAYLATNSNASSKFKSLFGSLDYLRPNPKDAYNLYIMTLGRLEETGQSARFTS